MIFSGERQEKNGEMTGGEKGDFLSEIRAALNWFLDSGWFVFFIAAVVTLAWAFRSEIVGPAAVLLIGTLILIFRRDLTPLIPIVCFAAFSYFFEERPPAGVPPMQVSQTYITTIIAGSCVLALGIAWYLVRFFVLDKRRARPGSLWMGMLIAGVVSLLSGIACATYDKFNVLIVFGVGLGVYAFYFLVVNCTRRDLRNYACTVMLMAGFIILIEMGLFYGRLDNPLQALESKAIRIGWGMSNSIGTLLVMCFPAAFYLAARSRHSWAYVLAAALFGVGLVVTMSRGNLIFGTVVFLASFLYAAVKTPGKLGFFLAAGLVLAGILTFLFVFKDKLLEIYEHMLDMGVSDNGRIKLWKRAMERFRQNPLFGCGYMGDTSGMFVGNLWKVHCTPLQILSSAGIVGALGFLLFYFQRYKLLLTKLSMFKIFAFLLLFGYEAYGIIDLTFFIVYQIFFVFLFLGAAEKEEAGREPALGASKIKSGKPSLRASKNKKGVNHGDQL